jgi:prepilin-type processing-associated H-X9-DG protein
MSQPPGYEPRTPMPKRETPGIAIASLVCGILSWVCVGLLAAIPAVITGHMALGRIKRSAGALAGRGLAIAGLILGYTSIVAMIAAIVLFFALVVPLIKEESSKAVCLANLQMIGKACQAYAAEHNGAFPERLSQLYEAGLVPSLDGFVCPSTGAKIGSPQEIDSKTSYEYRGAGLNLRTVREPSYQVILACDKPGNHRRGKNILYADGHVESEGMGGGSGSHGMDWD